MRWATQAKNRLMLLSLCVLMKKHVLYKKWENLVLFLQLLLLSYIICFRKKEGSADLHNLQSTENGFKVSKACERKIQEN